MHFHLYLSRTQAKQHLLQFTCCQMFILYYCNFYHLLLFFWDCQNTKEKGHSAMECPYFDSNKYAIYPNWLNLDCYPQLPEGNAMYILDLLLLKLQFHHQMCELNSAELFFSNHTNDAPQMPIHDISP